MISDAVPGLANTVFLCIPRPERQHEFHVGLIVWIDCMAIFDDNFPRHLVNLHSVDVAPMELPDSCPSCPLGLVQSSGTSRFPIWKHHPFWVTKVSIYTWWYLIWYVQEITTLSLQAYHIRRVFIISRRP
jgi:hypothetical protein